MVRFTTVRSPPKLGDAEHVKVFVRKMVEFLHNLPMALHADYINFMKQVTPETTQEYMTQLKRFNMGSPGESDCPVFDGMYEYFAVRAAQNLVSKLRGMLFHNVVGSC